MNKYNLVNNLSGWLVFLISAIVYLLTMEPNSSFWDCGEFIATAYKLQVTHPPGAPLFLLVGRFFSLFASDTSNVAMMINAMSALVSAFTIMFLFWTITHLTKKIIVGKNEIDYSKLIIIIGSGFVGALAYTFSDTFWFSAVEGEVYASSSLFTALIFWAILKWENVSEEKYANRWLILIAYLMGLSIGIHLLGLLAIPAIAYVYYFKNYKVSKRGIIYTLIISVIILGFIQYGIIPGVVRLASLFELLFINGFGLPYNSGLIFFIVVLFGATGFGIYITYKKGKVLLNTILLSIVVILIGYSSFTMVVVRSLANPPMDMNNPENVFSLLSYLNREQYGDRPLFSGQYYNAPLDTENPYKKGSKTYIKKDDKYVVSRTGEDPNFDKRFTTFFPRMYSPKEKHIKAYKSWGKIKGTSIKVINSRGEQEKRKKPKFSENLRFFFSYQLGHMYFRYFMWNYAGRQNGVQGHGELLNGNWISGIPFVDKLLIGEQDDLTDRMINDKTRNTYYLLPFLLGIIGLLFNYKKTPRDFVVVMLLFFFTGIAIVLYLNQHPYQPRERDYAYAGSFYAFAIWIGLGTAAIYDFLKKKLDGKFSSVIAVLLCLIFVPGILARENWDDHDRSGRYTTRDFASNYLNSCAPNAILFTNGDNDTFPLWYVQEVEGIRTDIRVINLSLLNTDWYIDQMKRKAYDSEPVPFKMASEKYTQGTRDVVYLIDRIGDYISLKQAMDFVADDDIRTKIPQATELDYIPSKKLKIAVDSAKIISSGTVSPENADKIVKEIKWNINRNYILKNDLMVLDLIANNNWERPIYFAITVGTENYLNLEEYFQLEGLAYRFVPVKTKRNNGYIGSINTDVMYDNIMNKFKFGRINDSTVFLNEDILRMSMNLRSNFYRLANELINENKKDSAIAVLDKCHKLMPDKLVPFNYFNLPIAECYYKLNKFERANEIIKILVNISQQNLKYFFSLDKTQIKLVENEISKNMMIIQEGARLTKRFAQKELNKKIEDTLNILYTEYTTSIK
ncbi:MAG: DUF2723 domain-containing protein [Bacteroidales bacterium]|nr:DUF2723 domain-containing protein [Bacteroidales bacterium]